MENPCPFSPRVKYEQKKADLVRRFAFEKSAAHLRVNGTTLLALLYVCYCMAIPPTKVIPVSVVDDGVVTPLRNSETTLFELLA